MNKRHPSLIWTLGFLALGVLLLLWALRPVESPRPRTPGLQRVVDAGVLRVATVNNPATWYLRQDQPAGLEYDLTLEFARRLGIDHEIVEVRPFSELFESVRKGDADLAAAAITATPERSQHLLFSEPYDFVTQKIIYSPRRRHEPETIEDLVDRDIAVIANSSYEETLIELRIEHPGLRWESRKDESLEDLFAEIADGKIEFTLADSTLAALHLRFYPSLAPGIDIGAQQPIAWAFALGDETLRDAANTFLQSLQASGMLQRLRDRYHAHISGYDRVNTRYFLRHIESRLPRYTDLFKTAASETGFDWRLLAAMGYQESQWRPDAVSRTGVRGIMMLTQATAGEMGVQDRRDPEESIRAGARYLRQMHRRLPRRISEPDRTWLALAAYNVGRGHLEDARVLTQRTGGDPDRWRDIARHLPLLSNSKYYSTVRYGYARGREPVHYVRNIRSYYDILNWYEQQD